jgi:hypothetical protein
MHRTQASSNRGGFPRLRGRAVACAIASTRISLRDVQRLIALSHEYGLLPKSFDADEVLAR